MAEIFFLYSSCSEISLKLEFFDGRVMCLVRHQQEAQIPSKTKRSLDTHTDKTQGCGDFKSLEMSPILIVGNELLKLFCTNDESKGHPASFPSTISIKSRNNSAAASMKLVLNGLFVSPQRCHRPKQLIKLQSRDVYLSKGAKKLNLRWM